MSTRVITAAVFQSGNSQAIRLPKEFRVNAKRVTLERVGNRIIVTDRPGTMAEFMERLPVVPDAPFAPDDGPEEPVEGW